MISVTFKEDDTAIGVLSVEEKQFKTGSRGYFGVGKIKIGEKRYQAQVQLVEIGSKPKDSKEEEGS